MSHEKSCPKRSTEYRSIFEFENFLTKSGLSAVQRALLKVRISQINKCGFCEDLHIQELRAMGDAEYRITSLRSWRKQVCFTESEIIILGIAEELSGDGSNLSKQTLDKACSVLGQAGLGQVITILLVTNFWNKIFTGVMTLPAFGPVQLEDKSYA